MIDERDSLEIFVEGDMIIHKAYKSLCFFCGSSDDLKQLKGKNIFVECRVESSKL